MPGLGGVPGLRTLGRLPLVVSGNALRRAEGLTLAVWGVVLPASVLDAVAALPRLALALEQLGEVRPALDRLADATEGLDELAELAPVLDRMGAALERAKGPLENLTGLGPVLERIADARPAIERIGKASGDIARIADAGGDIGRIADAAPVLRRLAGAAPALKDIAGARPAIEEIAGARAALEEIAAARPSIEQIAAARPGIDRIAGSGPAIDRIAAASASLEQIAHADEALRRGDRVRAARRARRTAPPRSRDGRVGARARSRRHAGSARGGPGRSLRSAWCSLLAHAGGGLGSEAVEPPGQQPEKRQRDRRHHRVGDRAQRAP